MPPLDLWAWAFLWTCLLEIPIVALFLAPRVGLPLALGVGLLAQVMTHPALWYVAPRFQPYAVWLVTMETAVTVAEAALFWALLRYRTQPRALAWALGAAVCANVFSTLVGLYLV